MPGFPRPAFSGIIPEKAGFLLVVQRPRGEAGTGKNCSGLGAFEDYADW
jgi:hypothetical protein